MESAPGHAQSGQLVLPGDEVAVVEEFEAGDGTYEEEGRVRASVAGVLELDPTHRVARVRSFNPPAELRMGDIVYASVEDLKSSMAVVTVLAVHGRKREITGETEGAIHISKISDAYIEDIRDAFRLGDIVRAKVIQAKPSLQLTTAEPALGAVRALCTMCRGPLERRGSELWCPRDEQSERRKVATDFGDLRLDVPAAELGGGVVAEEHRAMPEREGRGRDRGGPRGPQGRGGGREGGRGYDRGRGPRGRGGRGGRGSGPGRERR